MMVNHSTIQYQVGLLKGHMAKKASRTAGQRDRFGRRMAHSSVISCHIMSDHRMIPQFWL